MGETMNSINEFFQDGVLWALVFAWGKNIGLAIVIFIIGRWIARALSRLMVRALTKANVDDTLVRFLRNIAYTLLLVAVVIAAVDPLGVKTTSFLAILGAAGLAIGLALKDSLSNFSAGVMLVMFRPFKIGDSIEAGGVSGKVEGIQLFNTLMKTGDNRQIIVPNAQIYAGTITNNSACDTRRIDLVIGIGYDDDIGKAKEVLDNVLKNEQRVLQDPAPTIMVLELADSSVNLAVRPWVASGDYWSTRGDLLHNIKTELEGNGLSIPYPQQDVHMHQQN